MKAFFQQYFNSNNILDIIGIFGNQLVDVFKGERKNGVSW